MAFESLAGERIYVSQSAETFLVGDYFSVLNFGQAYYIPFRSCTSLRRYYAQKKKSNTEKRIWRQLHIRFLLHFIGEQRLDSCTGSFLLGTLFTAADAFAHYATVEGHRHSKALIMVRAGLASERIAEDLIFLLLYQFLQGGLKVGIV